MSTLYYNIIAAVLTLAILYGLHLMSNVKTAVRGNMLCAASMALAIVITMFRDNSLGSPTLWVAIVAGMAFGLFLANQGQNDSDAAAGGLSAWLRRRRGSPGGPDHACGRGHALGLPPH